MSGWHGAIHGVRVPLWRVATATALVFWFGAPACSAEQTDDNGSSAETRAIMAEIFEGLRVALPASADPERFEDPEARAVIGVALEALAKNASAMEQHSRGDDPQTAHLARSVAKDAREVQDEYMSGHYHRAAFLLRQITEDCIACHTRLPGDQDSRLSIDFIDATELETLSAESRATVLIATRRFDDALAVLEGILASPEHAAILIGPLTDYLVISIRVKGDYARPEPVLRRFAERRDLWPGLRSGVERWVKSLPVLEKQAKGKSSLEEGRRVYTDGLELQEVPRDHAALVHMVVASTVLQAFVDSRPDSQRDLAEAYYLLGIIEARIGRNYWVTAAPFLLETAIRLAPGEPFASEAYGVLEREVLMTYEGSDEEEIPAEDREHLNELLALIDAN